jgi:hypothetical protein
VTGLLLERELPVRAMVRREDDRAAAFPAAGAEVVVGDLLEPADVYRIVSGCRRVYFGMSVSVGYLEGTVTIGGGSSGTLGQHSGQHVANNNLPHEHPEHHDEPSAAAALAQR